MTLKWNWTPRRHNREADLLSRRAIRQVRQDSERFLAAMQAIGPTGSKSQRGKLVPIVDLRVNQPMGL